MAGLQVPLAAQIPQLAPALRTEPVVGLASAGAAVETFVHFSTRCGIYWSHIHCLVPKADKLDVIGVLISQMPILDRSNDRPVDGFCGITVHGALGGDIPTDRGTALYTGNAPG